MGAGSRDRAIRVLVGFALGVAARDVDSRGAPAVRDARQLLEIASRRQPLRRVLRFVELR